MTTLPLFDTNQSEANRDSALNAVAEHHAEWIDTAVKVLRLVCEQQPVFTSDEVWRRVAEAPSEPRAMGAVMQRGKALGWMAPTPTFQPTTKISQHRQPVRVWRSLLWGGVFE